ncbi:MarR family winged helix-turn-helix transcriptional regulator [Agromyces seonyuensis]|uniref:MarR family transcriptional regulator n=1 Tax=Agromyces seonyuensis TaxID=2662446 RepID=A0A6I4P6W7_9MICO|nr:MarR family transcriptional regulator [Agromyces seonyuensis]MWB99434.1 MarR family transcriptional regulator [Agromyces seonyuensis]
MESQDELSASHRPPSLLALPSYLAGNVAHVGNRTLVAKLKEHGIGLAQYGVLVALADFGALPPHELARRLSTDRSHISAYVEVLQKRGWVIREPDAADRRRVIVALTDGGRSLATGLMTWAAEAQADFLSALSESEQRTLRTLLLKILASAEASDAPTYTDRTGAC